MDEREDFNQLLGYQLADEHGNNIQGDDGFQKYASYEVLSLRLAGDWLAYLCAERQTRFTLQPIFAGTIEEPTFRE